MWNKPEEVETDKKGQLLIKTVVSIELSIFRNRNALTQDKYNNQSIIGWYFMIVQVLQLLIMGKQWCRGDCCSANSTSPRLQIKTKMATNQPLSWS